MGIGMILVVAAAEAASISRFLAEQGEESFLIGKVVAGNHSVELKGGVFGA